MEDDNGEPAVDLDEALARILQEKPRELSASDPRHQEGFGRTSALVCALKETPGIDDSLTAILRFALAKIPGADTAAILLEGPRREPVARLAWVRGRARPAAIRFGPGLFERLPPDGALLVEASGAGGGTAAEPVSGMVVPLWGRRGRPGVLYLDNRQRRGVFREEDLFAANALASLAAVELMQERRAFLSRVEENMSQYFGPEVVRLILQETAAGRPLQPGMRECRATILFVDLEGFSAFCRGRRPAEIVELLNPYFEVIAGCIQRHGGHVDKFLGDGVMGVFGAHPLAGLDAAAGDHAAQAVRAARDMIAVWSLRAIDGRNPSVPLRVGINSGEVLVGNIGYAARLEYSVIGDPVNMASRMEKFAPADGIAVTDETKRLAGPGFPFEDAGLADIKGFGQVRVWTLV